MFTVDVQGVIQWYFVSSHNEFNLTTHSRIYDIIYTEDEVKNFSGLSQIVFNYSELPEDVKEVVLNETISFSTSLIPRFGIYATSWKVTFEDIEGNYSGWLGISLNHPSANYNEICFGNVSNCSQDPYNNSHCCFEISESADKQEALNALIIYLNENNINSTVKFGIPADFPIKGTM
jgi:hypothetical protein